MPERDLRAEERHYSRIIEKNPADSSAYVDRANVYLDLGLRARAFADYSRAIDLDPDCPIAYFNRGNLNLEEGRY
jgi:tetratricopeptide (TPR) repeat protein